MPEANQFDGAEEQSTARFRVRVKADENNDLVIIRIDREAGSGRSLYETICMSFEECEALKIALMNETD